jgi:hypothetical protein
MALRTRKIDVIVVGFASYLLDKYADMNLSPKELCSFIKAGWDLWSRDPNRKRFEERLDDSFDELWNQRKPLSEIGKYLARKFKN